MEPSLPMPPQESRHTEIVPEGSGIYGVEQSQNPAEQSGELAPTSMPPVTPSTPPMVALPQPVSQSQNAVPTDDNPQIADDVDVIEREWVDKAKKIVDSTKSDPREQEKQVSKLQADYILKRYNKQIKTAE